MMALKSLIFHFLTLALSLVLPILAVSMTVVLIYNADWLQRLNWALNDIPEKTGLSIRELETVTNEIQGYVYNGDDLLNISVPAPDGRGSLFNERETLHMRDVKGLVLLSLFTAIGSGVTMLAALALGALFWRLQVLKMAARATGLALIVSLPVLVVLGVLGTINFNWLFTQFHLLSFANDLWLLSPRDYMLRLFPQPFWLLSAVILFGLIVLEMILVWVVAKSMNRKFNGSKRQI